MALGIGRATALVACGCALVALAWLPPRATSSHRSRLEQVPEGQRTLLKVTRESTRLWREVVLANEGLLFLKRRDSLADALTYPSGGPASIAAPNVPQSWKAWLADQTEQLAPRAGLDQAAGPVLSAVFLDTARQHRQDMTSRRLVMWTNSTIVALDSAAAPFSCLAIHDIRRMTLSRNHTKVLAGPSAFPSRTAFGICGFFAMYGQPGRGVRAWIDNGGWRFGMTSGARYRPPFRFQDVQDLSGYAWTEGFYAMSACIEGAARGCREWVLAPNTPSHARILNGVFVSTWGMDAFGGMLSDLAAEMRPERMRAFWTASLPADRAFQSAFGVGLGEWVLSWLDRWYGPLPRRGPRPGDYGTTVLIAVALIAFGTAKAYGRNVRS